MGPYQGYILMALAVVIGVAYFMRRRGRLNKED
jgi:hypothetical protein